MSSFRDSICVDCIYGAQPGGVYPIICVFDANDLKEMWHDKFKCANFKKAPEFQEEVIGPMEPFQVMIYENQREDIP